MDGKQELLSFVRSSYFCTSQYEFEKASSTICHRVVELCGVYDHDDDSISLYWQQIYICKYL